MTLANGQLKRRASTMTSRLTWFVIGNELAVLEIPQWTGFFRTSSPSAHADHFIESRPTRERIIRGMDGYETATAGNVVLECRLQFRRPPLIRSIVVEDDGLVYRKVRPEPAEVTAGGRSGDNIDLKQSGLFELFFEYAGYELPLVIWPAALSIENHDARRALCPRSNGRKYKCGAHNEPRRSHYFFHFTGPSGSAKANSEAPPPKTTNCRPSIS